VFVVEDGPCQYCRVFAGLAANLDISDIYYLLHFLECEHIDQSCFFVSGFGKYDP